MTGSEKFPAKIKCGVFKGTTRTIFVDKREFTGPIQNQIEEAYQYVLAKINLGAKIDGLYRQDVYEMPVSSIREIIANAITHRSYIQSNNVQAGMIDEFSKYGLNEPELIDMDGDFRVNFYRKNENVTINKNVTKNVTIEEKLSNYFSSKKLERMINIIKLIEEDSKITIEEI